MMFCCYYFDFFCTTGLNMTITYFGFNISSYVDLFFTSILTYFYKITFEQKFLLNIIEINDEFQKIICNICQNAIPFSQK